MDASWKKHLGRARSRSTPPAWKRWAASCEFAEHQLVELFEPRPKPSGSARVGVALRAVEARAQHAHLAPPQTQEEASISSPSYSMLGLMPVMLSGWAIRPPLALVGP